MKILSENLEVEVETWDDPGDYPSNAGSGPLPSYQYPAEVVGEVKIQLSEQEVAELREAQEAGEVQDWASNLDISLPGGILSVKWDVHLTDQTAVLTVTEFEADSEYSVSEPDYDYGD